MPTLITTMPVSPASMPVVHAAQAARWTVLRTTGGRLPTPAKTDTAMYGDSRILLAVARMNRLELLAPPEDWVAGLPREFQCTDSNDAESVRPGESASFEYEFRCFVNEGIAMAASPVRHTGVSCQERGRWIAPDGLLEEAAGYCEALLARPDVAAPPAFALDVGLTHEKHWLVIAGHPSWSAEIYGCSPSAVLEVLQRSCLTQREISHEDEAWLIA